LPSPTGSLVTSTDAAALAVPPLEESPLEELVLEEPALVAAFVLADVAGDDASFALEPHAEATPTATMSNAIEARQPDMADDRTVPSGDD